MDGNYEKILVPSVQGSQESGVVTFSAQLPQGYNEENACMLHFLLAHVLWHEAG